MKLKLMKTLYMVCMEPWRLVRLTCHNVTVNLFSSPVMLMLVYLFYTSISMTTYPVHVVFVVC